MITVSNATQSPLDYALCPSSSSSCRAVTHLRCLAQDFLHSQPAKSSTIDISHTLVPRGGNCRSCHEYILWGDVIRGCYRRQKGGVVQPEEADTEGEDETEASALSEELEALTDEHIHDTEQSVPSEPKGKKRKASTSTQDKATVKPKPKSAKRTKNTNIVGPDASPQAATKRKVGRPRKAERAYHTIATNNVGTDLVFK